MSPAHIGILHSKMRVSQNCYVKAIILCFIVLVLGSYSHAKEWRGITPLHSTRADVERLLGPPAKVRNSAVFYEFDKEEVSFDFANGYCEGEPDGWNVPRDTVTSIWVIPKPNVLKVSDLKLDESKYKKERDKEVQYIVRYINEVEGISYEVDNSADGMVTLIKYLPAAKDNYLRCGNSGKGSDLTNNSPEIQTVTLCSLPILTTSTVSQRMCSGNCLYV
jgi:hypothetical protein